MMTTEEALLIADALDPALDGRGQLTALKVLADAVRSFNAAAELSHGADPNDLWMGGPWADLTHRPSGPGEVEALRADAEIWRATTPHMSTFDFYWAALEASRELDGDPPIKDTDMVLHYSGSGCSASVDAGALRKTLAEAASWRRLVAMVKQIEGA